MGEVVNLGMITKHDIPPDRVLEAASGQLTKVVVIGFDKDGELYTAASCADGGDILWLLESCKMRLMGQ